MTHDKRGEINMQLLIDYVEKVLETQKDPDGTTPLLADAINPHTGELFRWRNEGGDSFIVSNFANQQNFMRLLTGLSHLTEEKKYKDIAVEITKYMMAHYMGSDGLLYWGGHSCVDLETKKTTGPYDKGMVHELKNCLPYYDLMFEADAEKAKAFIEAFWNAHIYNWEEMEVGRHGIREDKPKAYPFSHSFVEKEPHRESTGLSFMNAGNDLIYAASKYYQYTQDERAYAWGEFLARQYVKARDPITKLGAYQFTQKVQSIDPSIEGIPDSDSRSIYGDRAKRQFGHRFPNALESRMLLRYIPKSIYSINTLLQLQIYSDLGMSAKHYEEWSMEAIYAFIKYLYQPEENTVKPMITDGTDLSEYILEKDGYYGKKGDTLQPAQLTPDYLVAFCKAYEMVQQDPNLSREDKEILWETIRSMMKGLDLGDIGEYESEQVQVNLQTTQYEATALLAILDLYKTTKNTEFLELGKVVGNNMVEHYYNHGYFSHNKDCLYADLNRIEPLALLALEAALQGKEALIPPFVNGKGYIDGGYQLCNGEMVSTATSTLYEIFDEEQLKKR